MKKTLEHLVVVLLCLSYQSAESADVPREGRFEKVWAFCNLGDDAHAAKLAGLNVQVARVREFSEENRARARKYGLKLAVSVWPSIQSPAGHAQMLSDEERQMQEECRTKRRHAYGGEPLRGVAAREVMPSSIDCFVGEVARSNAVRGLRQRLAACPGVGAVLFDFFGYVNYRRCRHPDCERLYRAFLAARSAADTPENEKAFFLGELVAMNNTLHDAAKACDPAIVTVAHLYPVYLPEPLYGNRLKFDRIGETCAWYVAWPDEKIRQYAADCRLRPPADAPRAQRVPFIGFTSGNWCARKTPADLARELALIRASGARELMVHEIEAVLADPEVYAVFRRFCSRD